MLQCSPDPRLPLLGVQTIGVDGRNLGERAGEVEERADHEHRLLTIGLAIGIIGVWRSEVTDASAEVIGQRLVEAGEQNSITLCPRALGPVHGELRLSRSRASAHRDAPILHE